MHLSVWCRLFAPELELEPDHILPVVLPPLLFAATQRAMVREFQEAIEHARRRGDEGSEGMVADELSTVLREATDIERSLVLEARRRGHVSPASADEVLRDVEGRLLRDFR